MSALDVRQDSALPLSCTNGHTRTVRQLVWHGADPWQRNSLDLMPIDVAEKYGHRESYYFLEHVVGEKCILTGFLMLCSPADCGMQTRPSNFTTEQTLPSCYLEIVSRRAQEGRKSLFCKTSRWSCNRPNRRWLIWPPRLVRRQRRRPVVRLRSDWLPGDIFACVHRARGRVFQGSSCKYIHICVVTC